MTHPGNSTFSFWIYILVQPILPFVLLSCPSPPHTPAFLYSHFVRQHLPLHPHHQSMKLSSTLGCTNTHRNKKPFSAYSVHCLSDLSQHIGPATEMWLLIPTPPLIGWPSGESLSWDFSSSLLYLHNLHQFGWGMDIGFDIEGEHVSLLIDYLILKWMAHTATTYTLNCSDHLG